MDIAVRVDARQYKISEGVADRIRGAFEPVIAAMEDIAPECERVASLEPGAATSQQARSLRLKLVKIRTTASSIHKAAKEGLLAEGRYIDAWKNAQASVSAVVEEQLEALEKHQERMEQQRRDALQAERAALVLPYGEAFVHPGLCTMETTAWETYLAGARYTHEHAQELARKRAEEDQEKERAVAEERARIRAENDRLRAERDALEAAARAEREKQMLIENARRARERAESAARDAAARKEREAHEAALREERAAREKADEERAALARAEQARRAQEEEDARARERAIQDAATRRRVEDEAAFDLNRTTDGYPRNLLTPRGAVEAIAAGRVRHITINYGRS